MSCNGAKSVKWCGFLIVFDLSLFELFLTRILITGYYYYYYYNVCVVKHLIPLAGVCINHAPAYWPHPVILKDADNADDGN